jgi:L-threonylcarbamoyladenylate synthase
MNTLILNIEKNLIELDKISIASEVIKNSGLVAFPTETVYGLGANALDANAVKKIFIAKGRPSDNPLIVHVHSKEQVIDLVKEIPKKAEKLINAFWPGPLTLILKSNGTIPKEVTAGLSTVAVRMPNHKIALELIKNANVPIVAPSANLSGKPSPTIAEHVIEDLKGKIDVIIDGGSVNIGLESTVIDLTKKDPIILRPGKITKNQIQEIIGNVKENKKIDVLKPLSPGMKYKHYSPNAKVIIIKNEKEIASYSKKFPYLKIKFLKYASSKNMGKNLFKDFRLMDKLKYDIILVKEIDDDDFSKAVMDRLSKASEYN